MTPISDPYFVIILILIIVLLGVAFFHLLKNQKNQHKYSLLEKEKNLLLENHQQYITQSKKNQQDAQIEIDQIRNEIKFIIDEKQKLIQETVKQHTIIEQFTQLEKEKNLLSKQYQQNKEELNQHKILIERIQTQQKEEQKSFEEKIAILKSAKDELKIQFEHLANKIFEEKSKKFTEQNQNNMNQLIHPIQDKMKNFSKLVQETYEKETRERSSLKQELKHLQEMNQQLSSQANALTTALTGKNNKIQGNWGEMILEKILESSGLRKNIEYSVQKSFTTNDLNEKNTIKQPDIIIHLPDNKNIIIDSKVSLTSYVNYINTSNENDKQKQIYLKSLVESVRQHIKELSSKNYHHIPSGQSLDFVLMFIPIEPAYLLALQHDEHLLETAFNKQIMLVGPSTLLAMLKTVSSIWRYENQTQNALNIAKAGGDLYDKFVIFLDRFEKIGRNLARAHESFEDATKTLTTGKGNLVIRMHNLKNMGAQTNKKIDQKFFEYQEDFLNNKILDESDVIEDNTESL